MYFNESLFLRHNNGYKLLRFQERHDQYVGIISPADLDHLCNHLWLGFVKVISEWYYQNIKTYSIYELFVCSFVLNSNIETTK